MNKRKKDTPVISYPPEAILEIHHVADWLRVGQGIVEKKDIPCFYLGDRTRRYLAKKVLEHIEKLHDAA